MVGHVALVIGGSPVQGARRVSRTPAGLERKVCGVEGASVDLEGDRLVGAERERVDQAQLDGGRDAGLLETFAYIGSLSLRFFKPQSELIKPASPQAAQLSISFVNFTSLIEMHFRT